MAHIRQAHWVRGNKQERIPPRMVAFDTESRSYRMGEVETQEWRTGCAIRWRTDLKTGDHAEARVFSRPEDLWKWVDEYGHKEQRTVVWAHNLGHDVRISCALTILPRLGYTLEWCNLDRNVSAMIWRSDHGTIVLADTWTWLPVSLATVAPYTGLVKFSMPHDGAGEETWDAYCMRDTQIVYRIVRDLVSFIRDEHLGNWQPTGAGMAYATWRHKFMEHKVLVHDVPNALDAERAAMHTGRAEAWKHGKFSGPVWTEVDMRNAYVTVASECDVPRKLRMHVGRISNAQFTKLCGYSAVLCRCDITTSVPSVPYKTEKGYLWPVGTFTTWLWDTEIQCALRYGGTVTIREAYVYDKAPVLAAWGTWILSVLRDQNSPYSPIVRTWLKHCSRALIGRLSLKTRSWEYFGENPDDYTGITHLTEIDTGQTRRLMHVGNQTLIEGDADESRDSIPMITGYIMSVCRVRLWDAMNAAGLDQIAHVDTDSLLITSAGLAALKAACAATWAKDWQVKGSWRTIDVHGPRHYYRGAQRVIAGIPLRASAAGPGAWAGERWASLATDLEARGDGVVTTWSDTWTERKGDPRRCDASGVAGDTKAYTVAAGSVSNISVVDRAAEGE